MGNIIKIKHGATIPETNVLQEHELGYVDGSNSLYIGKKILSSGKEVVVPYPLFIDFPDKTYLTNDGWGADRASKLSELFGGDWEYLGDIVTSTGKVLNAWRHNL